jgi:hypothetical protein
VRTSAWRLDLQAFAPADTEQLLEVFRGAAARRFLLDGLLVSEECVTREAWFQRT